VTTPAENGILAGTFTVCCDAHGSTAEAGVVVATNQLGVERTLHVGSSGRFSVALPQGRYWVVGGMPRLHGPVGECQSTPANREITPVHIIIRASTATRVRVNC
jgi:hypothetical protein